MANVIWKKFSSRKYPELDTSLYFINRMKYLPFIRSSDSRRYATACENLFSNRYFAGIYTDGWENNFYLVVPFSVFETRFVRYTLEKSFNTKMSVTRCESVRGKKFQGRNHIFFKQAAVFLSMDKRYLLAAYFKP